MKIIYIKDKNRRNLYKILEKKKIILNYIIRNLNLSKKLRYKAYILLIKIGEQNSITKIKNRCILSNRSKAIYRRFKLSRIFFKQYALKGSIMGVKKASW